MKNSHLSVGPHSLTNSSIHNMKQPHSSYKITKKFNPSIPDDFYSKKKVNFTQEQKHLKISSAKKLQKFFRKILSHKKLTKLKNLQKKSSKPLLAHFETLSKIFKSKLKKYWKKLRPCTKGLTFDLSCLNIKPELLEKLQIDDKGMISYLFEGLGNETQTFVKDVNESHTFFKVFSDGNAEKEFQVKAFDDFDEINFSKFDFMEIELPNFIGKDFNPHLWKKNKIEDRVRMLNSKVLELNDVLLKELNKREDLLDERNMLQSIIKKIINLNISKQLT